MHYKAMTGWWLYVCNSLSSKMSYDLVSNPGVHMIRMNGEHLLDTAATVLPRGNYGMRSWVPMIYINCIL